MLLTVEQVQHACPGARQARIAAILPHLNAAGEMAEWTTPLRWSMALAQLGHESGDFQWLTEIWGNTPAQIGYEGRRDLGNFVAGDGYRFRGRGLLQITGRANYERLGKRLGIDLLCSPDLLSQPEWAAKSAALFWMDHRLNDYADRGDVEGATRKINGGTNGLMDRHIRYDRACEALGALSLYV